MAKPFTANTIYKLAPTHASPRGTLLIEKKAEVTKPRICQYCDESMDEDGPGCHTAITQVDMLEIIKTATGAKMSPPETILERKQSE